MPSKATLYAFLLVLMYIKLLLSDADTNHTIYAILSQIKKNVTCSVFNNNFERFLSECSDLRVRFSTSSSTVLSNAVFASKCLLTKMNLLSSILKKIVKKLIKKNKKKRFIFERIFRMLSIGLSIKNQNIRRHSTQRAQKTTNRPRV
jgi:hypothetical protein